MKKLLVVCFIMTFIVAFKLGQDTRQSEFERRAHELPDDIEEFSNQDIEHILFDLPLQKR